MAVPRSDTMLDALESIRRQSKDSLDHYREAAPAVRRVREAFERALLERGGGDLAQTIDVNPDGSFALPDLPAGDWVLLEVHTEPGKKAHVPHPSRGASLPTATERFLPRATVVGLSYVTLWLRELTVTPGGAAAVTLTDRNAWMTGVLEERETPVFRVSPPVSAPGAPAGAPGTPAGTGTSGSSPALSPSR
jgi:hypothetical protein